MTLDTLPLLSDAEVDAIRPPGMIPDPEAAARYVAGAGDGHWHAVLRERAAKAAGQPGAVAVAVCGTLARAEEHHGTYDRMIWPFDYGLCELCAWAMAMITSSVEREIRLLTPSGEDAAQLAAHGVDSLLAVKIARAVLAGDNVTVGSDDVDMEAVTLLAHVTRHAPALTIDRACCEGDCGHDGDCPGGEPACWGCSLVTGEWAGADFEGLLIRRCHVKPPCSVLVAMAEAFGITAATSPAQAAALGRQVDRDA